MSTGPIHYSRSCCGRKQTHKAHRLRLGVQRIEDPHHPRGYRELRSPSEMRKLLNRKVREQDRKCAICHEGFSDYSDIVPDHKHPKDIGGPWRDDHPENVQAVHRLCNSEKGSRRSGRLTAATRPRLVGTARDYVRMAFISVLSGIRNRIEIQQLIIPPLSGATVSGT